MSSSWVRREPKSRLDAVGRHAKEWVQDTEVQGLLEPHISATFPGAPICKGTSTSTGSKCWGLGEPRGGGGV